MTEEVEESSVKLRELLDISVKKNLAECILFSGGLDTSVIAAVASSYTQLTGVTVSFHDPRTSLMRNLSRKTSE